MHCLPDQLVLPISETPALVGVLDALFTDAFDERRVGRGVVLNRLCEVMLIYTLRHALANGLLRACVITGLADARLDKALNATHSEPALAWTLQGLAALAGMSRARFAAHFADVVGQPAIEYLAHWCLSLTQTLLAQG